MRLESLLALVNGTLINRPTVHSFNSVQHTASKVSRGDLYIYSEQDAPQTVALAIEKGAYGIVTQNADLIVNDKELALILVDNTQEAELKLLRFFLLPKKLEVYYAKTAVLEYLKMLIKPPTPFTIFYDINVMFQKLWSIDEKEILLVPKCKEAMDLFPLAQSIEDTSREIAFEPLSPFESHIRYKGVLHRRQKLPLVLQNAFSTAVAFLEKSQVAFNMDTLSFIPSFNLFSFNSYLEPKEFGKGVKNILYIHELDLIEETLQSIQKNLPWAKLIFFSNRSLPEIRYNNKIVYDSASSLIKLLQQEQFEYAVIYGQQDSIIIESAKPAQMTLF